MAFEHKAFTDGEAVYKVPKWRERIEGIHSAIPTFSYAEETKRRQSVGENEVALKHPHNGSSIRIKDDGTIELFGSNSSGIRLGPNHTMQLFADTIQFIGRESKFHTSPNGVNANKKALAGEYPTVVEHGLTHSFLTLMAKERGSEA